MTTSWPGAFDTFPTHSAGQTILSADVNKLQAAVAALQQTCDVLAAVGSAPTNGAQFIGETRIVLTDPYAFTVMNAGGAHVFNVDTSASTVKLLSGTSLSLYSDNYATVKALIQGADGQGIFQGQISIASGQPLVFYADAARATQTAAIGTPTSLPGFTGISLGAGLNATGYAMAQANSGGDLYINAPAASTIHFRIANGAEWAQISANVGFRVGNASTNGPGGAITAGTGSPNGAKVGYPGDLYLNLSGGAAQTLWVKESGSNTNTGWVGK